MATSRMPDEFFDLVNHHLPPEPTVGPYGGRPPMSSPNCAESHLVRPRHGKPLGRCSAGAGMFWPHCPSPLTHLGSGGHLGLTCPHCLYQAL